MDEKAYGKLADIIQFLSKTNNDEKSVPNEDEYYKERYEQLKKLCGEFFDCLNAPLSKITDEEISSVLEECFGNNQARFENVVMSVDEFKGLLEEKECSNKQDLVRLLSNIQESCRNLLARKGKEISYAERHKNGLEELRKEIAELSGNQDRLHREAIDENKKNKDAINRAIDERFEKISIEVKKTEDKVNGAVIEVNDALKDVNVALEKAEDVVGQLKDNFTHVLTAIGIFTAIIIAVVACYLSYILNRVDELKNNMESLQQSGMTSSPFVNIARLGILACIVLLVAFFMVYLTAKMTDRSIACRPYKCAAKNCDECEKKEACCSLKRFWRRYPYITAILGVLLILSVTWVLFA